MSNHMRRKLLGAVINYNGNPDDGQLAVFANGDPFNERDLHFACKGTFTWKVTVKFFYRNREGFTRSSERTFASSPLRFNELGDYAHELAVMAGLDMPEGYKFHKETWRAKIIK